MDRKYTLKLLVSCMLMLFTVFGAKAQIVEVWIGANPATGICDGAKVFVNYKWSSTYAPGGSTPPTEAVIMEFETDHQGPFTITLYDYWQANSDEVAFDYSNTLAGTPGDDEIRLVSARWEYGTPISNADIDFTPASVTILAPPMPDLDIDITSCLDNVATITVTNNNVTTACEFDWEIPGITAAPATVTLAAGASIDLTSPIISTFGTYTFELTRYEDTTTGCEANLTSTPVSESFTTYYLPELAVAPTPENVCMNKKIEFDVIRLDNDRMSTACKFDWQITNSNGLVDLGVDIPIPAGDLIAIPAIDFMPLPALDPAGTYTFEITRVVTEHGCAADLTANPITWDFDVYSLPEVDIILPNTEFCLNETFSFIVERTDTDPFDTDWSFDWAVTDLNGMIVTEFGTETITGPATSISIDVTDTSISSDYRIDITNLKTDKGCDGADKDTNFKVNALPEVTITPLSVPCELADFTIHIERVDADLYHNSWGFDWSIVNDQNVEQLSGTELFTNTVDFYDIVVSPGFAGGEYRMIIENLVSLKTTDATECNAIEDISKEFSIMPEPEFTIEFSTGSNYSCFGGPDLYFTVTRVGAAYNGMPWKFTYAIDGLQHTVDMSTGINTSQQIAFGDTSIPGDHVIELLAAETNGVTCGALVTPFDKTFTVLPEPQIFLDLIGSWSVCDGEDVSLKVTLWDAAYQADWSFEYTVNGVTETVDVSGANIYTIDLLGLTADTYVELTGVTFYLNKGTADEVACSAVITNEIADISIDPLPEVIIEGVENELNLCSSFLVFDLTRQDLGSDISWTVEYTIDAPEIPYTTNETYTGLGGNNDTAFIDLMSINAALTNAVEINITFTKIINNDTGCETTFASPILFQYNRLCPSIEGIVHIDGQRSGDGSDWSNAAGSLAEALNIALIYNASNPPKKINAIYVAEGTYDIDNTLSLVDGVNIYGGFDPNNNAVDMTNRNPGLYKTILNAANNPSSVIEADGIRDISFDGFIIEGGVNTAINNVNNASVDYRNTIVRNMGTGIYNEHPSAAMIQNFLFADNTIAIDNGGDLVLTNVTVANHQPSAGVGIYNIGVMDFRNSIVWNNTIQDDYDGINYSFSLVQGLNPSGQNLDGTDPANDPMFVNSANGDYRIQPEVSKVTDAAFEGYLQRDSHTIDLASNLDLAGRPRVMNQTIDMGAYESVPLMHWEGGMASTEWSNHLNWEDLSGITIRFVPDDNVNVVIPGVAPEYPNLVAADNATVNDITFEMGGEIAYQNLLTYNRAFVEFNYGWYNGGNGTQENNKSTSPMIDRNRYYLISAPLKGMLVGDYAYGGKPEVYARYAQVSQDNAVTDLGDRIAMTEDLPAYNVDMKPGFGFAYKVLGSWLESNTPMSELVYDQTNLNKSKGVVRYPRFTDAGNFSHHETYNPDTQTSTFYYYYSGQPDVRIVPEKKDEFFRDLTETHRFIMEGEGGEVTIELPKDGNDDIVDSDIIVGNPFMAHLNPDAFFTANASLLENQFRIWNGDQIWTAYHDGIDWVNDDHLVISPMQAFFVQPKDISNPTITLKMEDNMTTTDVTNNFLRNSVSRELLKVSVNNGTHTSRALVLRKPGVTELGKGASKMFSMYEEVPEVFVRTNGRAMEIAEINETVTSLPLGISTTYAGKLTMTFDGSESLSTGVWLYDSAYGKLYSVTEATTLEFDIEGNNDGRFYVMFSQQAPTGTDKITAPVEVYAYDKNLYVNASSAISMVRIFSAEGKVLSIDNNINTTRFEKATGLATGVYLVEVTSDNGIIRNKVVIK